MITAKIDAIGREDQNSDVVYVQILKDGVLIENVCMRYDPKDDTKFRADIRARLLSADNSIETKKALAASALAEVVADVNKAIDDAKMEEK